MEERVAAQVKKITAVKIRRADHVTSRLSAEVRTNFAYLRRLLGRCSSHLHWNAHMDKTTNVFPEPVSDF
jgi:hypothetical protein